MWIILTTQNFLTDLRYFSLNTLKLLTNTRYQQMNKSIQCFVIDDEPDARARIKKFAARIPFLEITGEFGNAVDALFQVQNLKPDLIFLDVERCLK
jgi:response regulator RpfG family c-di-GMP phosphodiesterase